VNPRRPFNALVPIAPPQEKNLPSRDGAMYAPPMPAADVDKSKGGAAVCDNP
jgi:hypothetical protein